MNSKASASKALPRFTEKLLTGAALTLALNLATQGLIQPALRSEPLPQSASSAKAAKSQALQDGVYLYGQSSSADQIGSAYMVFEVKQRKVVGGFYMPRSSFDCFQGTVQSNELALSITDSYEKDSYPYAVALQKEAVSASASNPEAPSVGLAGFRQIKKIGSVDRRILSTCKANYSQR